MLAQKIRKYIIGKNGVQFITLKVVEVVFFTTTDKVVYAVMEDGRKLVIETRLAVLETELDASKFFRINRQYIINVFFIKAFLPYKAVQLIVELALKNTRDDFIVSQSLTPEFKKWIFNL